MFQNHYRTRMRVASVVIIYYRMNIGFRVDSFFYAWIQCVTAKNMSQIAEKCLQVVHEITAKILIEFLCIFFSDNFFFDYFQDSIAINKFRRQYADFVQCYLAWNDGVGEKCRSVFIILYFFSFFTSFDTNLFKIIFCVFWKNIYVFFSFNNVSFFSWFNILRMRW